MTQENITFCPECNKKVVFTIRQDIIKEYKGVEVNVEENIGVCSECGEDIFVMDLEADNTKRLYSKYTTITGKVVESKYKRK